MLDLPFVCFSEYGVQVADSLACGASPRAIENVVTCLYRLRLGSMASSSLVTVTWCKTLIGLAISLNTEANLGEEKDEDGRRTRPSSLSTTTTTTTASSPSSAMKPWLLRKKTGNKILELNGFNSPLNVIWDLSNAKYSPSGPEPIEGFFFAITFEHEIVLLLGDMVSEALTLAQSKAISTETSIVSRREHIFGKKVYSTRAQFVENGRTHDILIECSSRGREPKLCVRVDKQIVVIVKRLMWKFRGNQTILVDGLPVELFWDVHNWLFSPSDGHAVFMFQTSMAPDKSWSSLASTSSSLFQWNHVSASSSIKEECIESSGFSLLLYAWKSQ